MSRYQHEVGLAPIATSDCLQSLVRQFTGAPHITRAYVLNRTTGKVVQACGHQHRRHDTAARCAERMLAQILGKKP